MHTIQDIFQIWPSYSAMAKEIGQEPDTVRKWRGKRIPQEHWPAVINAASRRGEPLTAADLLRLNPSRKVRDPASYRRKHHKITKRGRARKQAISVPGSAQTNT